MKCPACGHLDDRVLDTRAQPAGDAIRRRRECLACHERFATVEILSPTFPLVIKKDGRREPYASEKIQKGIQAACQKRPVSLSQMEQIVARVGQWAMSCSDRELASDEIGKRVIGELRLLDNVAYVRFASVYQTFQDVQEFVSRLEAD